MCDRAEGARRRGAVFALTAALAACGDAQRPSTNAMNAPDAAIDAPDAVAAEAPDAVAADAPDVAADAPAPATLDPDDARGPLSAAVERCGRSFCSAALPAAGAGIALGDVDGDGLVDALLGDVGTRMRRQGPLTLLRNRGDLRFRDATAAAGLSGVRAWATSFGDLDGDGDLDLVVGGRLAATPDVEITDVRVFDNNGHGVFRERAARAAEGLAGAATVIQLVDLDTDGRLDIVVGTAGTDTTGTFYDHVLVARPDGGFDRLAPALDDPGVTWAVLPTDLDDDGRLDLLFGVDLNFANEDEAIADDARCALPRQQLLRRNGDWLSVVRRQVPGGPLRFALSNESLLFFTAPGSTPMSVAAADFNADGRLDYAAAQINAQQLFLSQPDGTRVERGAAAGITMPNGGGNPSVAWGMAAVDVDRDRRVDLAVAYGGIPTSQQVHANTLFLNRPDGRFEALAADNGFDPPGAWFALATADLDNDGDSDFMLGAQRMFAPVCLPLTERARVLRNDFDTAGRHWLRVRLRGTVSNPEGIGARIDVVTRGAHDLREVTRGAATLSASTPEVELGLGDVDRVSELVVRWPSGVTQRLRDVATDRVITVTEPRWVVVEPAVPRGGDMVTVRVRNEGLDRFAAAPTLSIRDGNWSAAPRLDGADTVATFRLDGTRDEATVAIEVPGSPVHALVRLRAR